MRRRYRRVVRLASYLPPPAGGTPVGPGNAPLELLALELSVLLPPAPPPRSKRSCGFVSRFQNESLPFGFFFCMFHLP